jgi:tetratricopeptide (TPR) repeat protein
VFSRLFSALLGRRNHPRAASAIELVAAIDALARAGDWAKAAGLIEQALDAYPHERAVLMRAAALSQQRRDHRGAESSLVRLIELAPHELAVRLMLAHSLHAQGRYADAFENLRRAEELSASQPDIKRAEIALWQGLSLLRLMRTQDAKKCFVGAFELDRSNDIPLQLAAYCDIMEFSWPTDRKLLQPAKAGTAGAEAEALDIVYFFISSSDTPHRSGRGIDYLELLSLSAASARRSMPGVRILLLTDEATRVPDALVDEVVRYEDLPSQQVMEARVQANARYLAQSARRNTILIDPGSYFLRDCRGAFGGEFDLGYTWRSDFVQSKQDLMPLYGKVMFVPAGHGEAASAFLHECLKCLDALELFPAVRAAYPQGIRRWWGDQLAPAAVVGWQLLYEGVLSRKSDRASVAGATLRFFDAEQYNFPIDRRDRSELEGRYIVGFKGERKRAMAEFARWYARAPGG